MSEAKDAQFVRLLFSEDKEKKLKKAISSARAGQTHPLLHNQDLDNLEDVPGAAYSYWVSESVLDKFKNLPQFESDQRHTEIGLQTSNDFRFVRCWWEVPRHSLLEFSEAPKWDSRNDDFEGWCEAQTHETARWVPLTKATGNQPYYADVHLVVDWAEEAREMKEFYRELKDRVSSPPGNGPLRDFPYYFEPAITWPRRAHRRGCFSHIPPGTIFSSESPMFLSDSDSHWPLLALLNSDAYIGLLHLLMPRGTGQTSQTLKYELGYLGSVPIPHLSSQVSGRLSEIARRAYSLERQLDTADETSRAFTLPAVLQGDGDSFEDRIASWLDYCRDLEDSLRVLHEEVNALAFEAYGLSEEDQAALQEGLPAAYPDPSDGKYGEANDDPDLRPHAHALLSYLVGCAFGRWDLRLALSREDDISVPQPFEPVPRDPPALLSSASSQTPNDYPIEIPTDGVLVDDPGHEKDITARIRQVLEVLFEEHPRRYEKSFLDAAKGRENLRGWIANRFFEMHSKRYSMNRRKAPIYWQLTSENRNYSIWIYKPFYDKDSLHFVNQEYLEPKIELERNRIEEQREKESTLEGSERREAQRTLEEQEEFLAELQEFQDSLLKVARLNLDPDPHDGTILNLAPLYDMVPWGRTKGPERFWDELVKGAHPWSTIHDQLSEAGLIEGE